MIENFNHYKVRPSRENGYWCDDFVELTASNPMDAVEKYKSLRSEKMKIEDHKMRDSDEGISYLVEDGFGSFRITPVVKPGCPFSNANKPY